MCIPRTKQKSHAQQHGPWSYLVMGRKDSPDHKGRSSLFILFCIYFYNKHEFYQKTVISILNGRCSMGLLDEKQSSIKVMCLAETILVDRLHGLKFEGLLNSPGGGSALRLLRFSER